MPAQVYVLAIISSVAAALLFKEYIYEPHIAPNMERWAEQYIAHREARRRQRQAPVPTPARPHPDDPRSTPPRATGGDSDPESSIELETLVTREVDEWRSKVNRSSTTLRHRQQHGSVNALDGRNPTLPYIAFSPTHVIFDLSSPTASTSTGSSPPRGSFTDARLEISSSPTLRSPDIPSIRLPTPESSLRPLSPGVLTDASIIASYEVAHAFDSPRSNLDIQSISNTPFSSRPQSPFSNFSGLGARQGAALFEAPVSEMDFFSDNGSFVPSVGGSVVGDDFDVQSNHWDASSTSSWVSAGTSSG